MDHRTELVRYYQLLRAHDLNDSHSGNASVRDGDTVWITPTGACADTLGPDMLVRCSLSGGPGHGASLDAPLHLAVYRANPAAQAVLHSHGPHAIALTLDGQDLVPVDFEGAYYFARVPVVEAMPSGAPQGGAEAAMRAADRAADYVAQSPGLVARALSQNPACIYRGHGVYAWGPTLDQAYKWSSSVEAAARIAWLARVAGVQPPRP